MTKIGKKLNIKPITRILYYTRYIFLTIIILSIKKVLVFENLK